MYRRLAILTAVTAALAPAAAFAQPAAPAGAQALKEATRLSVQWGTCPTSRPAQALLSQARTAPVSARARRAVAARTAWRVVVRECSTPTPMPTAVVGG